MVQALIVIYIICQIKIVWSLMRVAYHHCHVVAALQLTGWSLQRIMHLCSSMLGIWTRLADTLVNSPLLLSVVLFELRLFFFFLPIWIHNSVFGLLVATIILVPLVCWCNMDHRSVEVVFPFVVFSKVYFTSTPHCGSISSVPNKS